MGCTTSTAAYSEGGVAVRKGGDFSSTVDTPLTEQSFGRSTSSVEINNAGVVHKAPLSEKTSSLGAVDELLAAGQAVDGTTTAPSTPLEESEGFSPGPRDGELEDASPLPATSAAPLAWLDVEDEDLAAAAPNCYAAVSGTIIVGLAEGGDYKKVRLLLEADEDPNAVNKDENTCLHVAAANGHESIVWLLLANRADTARQNLLGDSPLHEAAHRGHLKIVEMLLGAGASPLVVNDDADTPLHSAARAGRVEVVKALVDAGAAVDVVNDSGMAPLHLAAASGDIASVQALVAKGADRTAKDRQGRTAADCVSLSLSRGVSLDTTTRQRLVASLQ